MTVTILIYLDSPRHKVEAKKPTNGVAMTPQVLLKKDGGVFLPPANNKNLPPKPIPNNNNMNYKLPPRPNNQIQPRQNNNNSVDYSR